MTARPAPRVAAYLMARYLRDNEPLAGDLLEISSRRSRAWLWRQVLAALLHAALLRITRDKRGALEGALVSCAMLVTIAFTTVVAAALLQGMWPDRLHLAIGRARIAGFPWSAGVLAFGTAVAAGRVFARLHRGHRVLAMLAFSLTTIAAALLTSSMLPPAAREPFMPHAALQIGLSALFVGGLFAGMRTRDRSRFTARAVAVWIALAGSAFTASAQAQFEVASIKRNVDSTLRGSGLSAPQPGGRYVARGVTLRRLVQDAYDSQVVGGPAWADSDRFDVTATGADDAPPRQIQQMLKALLADRFRLIAHTEPRETAVYAMRVARTDGRLGDKLTRSDAACVDEARRYFPVAGGGAPPCGDFRLGARSLSARGMAMAGLARLLSGRVGRPVVDRTGLDALFDLQLEWSSDLGLAQAPPDSAGADDLTADGLSLFTALQEQLGLRLEPGRAAIDVLVIDRAEAPSGD